MVRVIALPRTGSLLRLLCLLFVGFGPTSAHAIGLGELQVRSALNERLDARVPLRGLAVGEAEAVRAALAPEAAFRREDLERRHLLTRLRFEVHADGANSGSVHITSRDHIREPSLSFILEVRSPGRVVQRRYDVLLNLR